MNNTPSMEIEDILDTYSDGFNSGPQTECPYEDFDIHYDVWYIGRKAAADLATARRTQDQLRDELTAVTAERDELRQQLIAFNAERRKIWDMVMQADSSCQLTNDLYELMK